MDSRAEKRGVKYPHGKARIYWSVAITVSSIILALLILKSPVLLLSYLIFTLILAAIVLLLKMRFLSMRTSDPPEEKSTETVSWAQRWGPLLSLFVVMIAFVSLPLFLARFNPQIWFVSLVSYSSGVSIAEALFFLKTRHD